MDNRVTKVGIITDAHANLPAIRAALAALDAEPCDLIIHMGDAIGIGPHPSEVLALLLSRADMLCLMGNHDELFAHARLDDPPLYLSAGELEHQRWTHAQLDESWRERVRSWPMSFDLTLGETSIRFQHYAINNGDFGPVSRDNLPAELDAAFRPETDIVFFGHHHPRADVRGVARYINPGALGTDPGDGARYGIIELQADGVAHIALHSAPYDAETTRRAMHERAVPDADFILRTFLG